MGRAGVSLSTPHVGRDPEEFRSQKRIQGLWPEAQLALRKKAFELSLLRGSHKLS